VFLFTFLLSFFCRRLNPPNRFQEGSRPRGQNQGRECKGHGSFLALETSRKMMEGEGRDFSIGDPFGGVEEGGGGGRSPLTPSHPFKWIPSERGVCPISHLPVRRRRRRQRQFPLLSPPHSLVRPSGW